MHYGLGAKTVVAVAELADAGKQSFRLALRQAQASKKPNFEPVKAIECGSRNELTRAAKITCLINSVWLARHASVSNGCGGSCSDQRSGNFFPSETFRLYSYQSCGG
ncbi:hypothetical protein [Hymenobacter arizonensis]|uniref:hypothetical protein n=1 Tax=Hymenobacter arizonensis TaxID=1227077 RepID=UPI001BE06D93|nr:hypothetical protein [Hymenobacter arizonensis]